MNENNPKIVKSENVHLDSDYVEWIYDVKQRFRKTQIKAAVKVNSEQLLFNWQLGADLVSRKAEEKWGSGIVEQVSLDLQNEFPEAKGFGVTNLWYMKRWYLFYSDYENRNKLQQLVEDLGKEIDTNNYLKQKVDLDGLPAAFLLPKIKINSANTRICRKQVKNYFRLIYIDNEDNLRKKTGFLRR